MIMPHLYRNEKKYLLFLAALCLITPFLSALILGRSLLLGNETLFILHRLHLPLHPGWMVLPVLLGLLTIFLFHRLLKERINGGKLELWAASATFLLLLSPGFIRAFTTFSSISSIAFLGIITLLWSRKEEKSKLALAFLLCLTAVFLAILLHQPFLRGPFSLIHQGEIISDFSPWGGISIFTLLLAFLGLGIVWQERRHSANLYRSTSLILLFWGLFTVAFFFPQAQFLLLFPTAVLASRTLVFLFQRTWNRPLLKDFTIFVILLTVFISTLTFLKHYPLESPTQDELAALEWIKKNTPEQSIIFSSPEESYRILAFAQRTPLFLPHDPHRHQGVILTEHILNSSYTSTTFPLLEENNVSFIFITPALRSYLHPPGTEQPGLLSLFKNERFKLRHARNTVEVWEFTKEKKEEVLKKRRRS